jgi:NDP-sugar pyrophosphorylase family protein
MSSTLVVLAAGISTRYGRLKQLEPVGPAGEALLEYAMYDALRAGFHRVVLVIRRELEAAFRAHLEPRWRGTDIRYAYQELTQIPRRVPGAAGRMKPWGTAHAVLAAEPAVDGAFAVCNADDFYGAEAYGSLAMHLRQSETAGEQAVVGYALRATLSPHGGVSRGLCETDRDGRLTRVVEILDARDERGVIAGRDEAGGSITLAPDAVVSMNLWGLTPSIFSLLRERFAVFLDLRGDDPKAEFLISTAANELVAAGRIVLRVLPTAETWMGVTYPDDRAGVVARLGALTRTGRYPEPLAAPPRATEEHAGP